MKEIQRLFQKALLCGALLGGAASVFGGANPSIGWSYGTIVANPHYPIVGETAHITVQVTNPGDAPASNVQVKISFNDWGVTFMGWQEIATVTIPSIPAGGTATAETDHIFVTRTHTCLEAVVVGADENTDPNDDRGQINLEVINSGETFSWDVPIVNNGDQPLHLLVVGACHGRPGADGQAPCREDVKEVMVPAGAEVIVPVNLDLRGIPPGQVLEFELNAFDLNGPGGAFLPQNRNHVLMRIMRSDARPLANAAKLQINAAAAGVGNAKLRKKIEEAARKVDQALTAAFWADDNHVKNASVFVHMQVAAAALESLLGDDLPLATKTALDEAARKLCDAARILVKAVNGNPQAGDAKRAAGDYPGAVHAYKHAWQSAP